MKSKKPFDLAASHPRPEIRPATQHPEPHLWTPVTTHSPAEPEAFTPMEDLLREMGLPPLKTQHKDAPKEIPLVPQHPRSVAEFSPPRPLRRAITRFAHLQQDTDNKD